MAIIGLRCAVLVFVVLTCAGHAVGRLDYHLFPGIGYYSLGGYVDSYGAGKQCRATGGHLVVINSEAEAEVLRQLFSDTASYGFAFVGYHDLFAEGEYFTIFGESLNSSGFVRWAGGKPNASVENNCGGYTTGGGLHNVPCESRQRFICEQELWRGYELVQNVGYYKLYQEAATWDKARRVCAQDGASLAILSSNTEYNTLQNILARYPSLPTAHSDDIIFLGFHDIFSEGDFVTLFGEPLIKTGYTEWNSGQPRNDTDVNCGTFTRRGLMSTNRCKDKYAFFCEHRLE